MCWNNDGASDSGYTRKKKETPITLPSASAFPPQLDGPAIIVYGPTPERADLGHEVPGPPRRISAVKSWSSATRRSKHSWRPSSDAVSEWSSPSSSSPLLARSPPTSTPTAAVSPKTNSCLHNQRSHRPGHIRAHVPPDPLQCVHNRPSPCLHNDVADLPRL